MRGREKGLPNVLRFPWILSPFFCLEEDLVKYLSSG